MTTEMLLLAVLAAMTIVALMILINSRGRWRATISSLLAICLLGGTAWVFILQYSVAAGSDSHFFTVFKGLLQNKDKTQEQEQAKEQVKEQTDQVASVSSLITQVNGFAGTLLNERMQIPGYTHDQLVARAADRKQRLDVLQNEINSKRQLLNRFPEAAERLEQAMTELNAACHFFRAYYFSENTEAEKSIERMLRQKAQNAIDTLRKAEGTVKQTDG
jgi:uncharacterized protein YoxC